MTPLNTHIILQEGSITRTQAQQFTLQVSSFLSTPFRDYNNRLLSNDIIIFKNYREVMEVLGWRYRGEED
jgi:hypothetical protein